LEFYLGRISIFLRKNGNLAFVNGSGFEVLTPKILNSPTIRIQQNLNEIFIPRMAPSGRAYRFLVATKSCSIIQLKLDYKPFNVPFPWAATRLDL
jgi:hypothetical protein